MPSAHAEIFREIVLNADEGIWTVDTSSRLDFINPRAAGMLGYKADELKGRPFPSLVTPDDLVAVEAQQAVLLSGIPDRREIRLRRHDGSTIWAQIASTPILGPDRSYRGAFSLCTDITERRRIDEALRLSEERYRSLLAAATDYVFTVPYADGHPGATVHGAGCVKVTGYTPADYAADPVLWYRMIAPEDRAAVEQHIHRANDGSRADTIEHRLLHRDGSMRWVRSTLVPRRNPAGALVAIDGLVTDITERTRALEQLRERETLYRAVMESSSDGFLIADSFGQIVEVNGVYCRRSGYARAELLAMGLRKLEDADSATTLASRLEHIVRNGHDLFETRHRTKDGTLWQAEVSVAYWSIGDGRLFLFVRDIQLRKRSEALLRTRLRLSELSRGGELDPLIQAALDDAELITGSCIGFFHFVAPDQEHLTLQTWSTNTQHHFCTAEGKGRHYPVSLAGIWVDCLRQRTAIIHNDYASTPGRRGLPPGHAAVVRELTVPILRDNLVVAIIGVGNKTTDYNDDDVAAVRDLADVAMDFVLRVQAEQSLRRNEHQLRLIIDAVPALIAYVDPQFRYKLFNDMYRTWFGDAPAAVAQRTVAEQLGSEAWQEVAPLMQRALTGEVVTFEKELNLRGAGVRWIHGTYTPDRGPDGLVRGIVILAQDVTAHKQMEEQLLRAQRLEVVGRLASGVAHDLNNILQPVLMAPRLLRPAIKDPDAIELVDTIEGSVRRGAEIIKQLLAFGRGTNVRRVPLRLDSLLMEIARILRETMPKNIVLRCELPPRSEPVEADATQIHQVLMNLCVNARDAMRNGGTLTVRLDSATFTEPPAEGIPAGRAGRFQVLTVTDTGTGITRENLPRLFDPFFTTKEVGEGTGLGLPTVLGIVRSHDGFLRVTSTLGTGSTFAVYLPELGSAPAPAADTPRPEPARHDGRRRHILVVDDETPVRDLIRQTLVQHNYLVSEAANGAEALVVYAQQGRGIDLVVTDILMPVMDGARLIEELHRQSPQLPIVAMSGHGGKRELTPPARSAIRILLPKPFESATLLDSLQKALA